MLPMLLLVAAATDVLMFVKPLVIDVLGIGLLSSIRKELERRRRRKKDLVSFSE